MAKFIEVTLKYDHKKVVVIIDSIMYCTPGEDFTYIDLVDGETSLKVVESYDEVKKLLGVE